MRYPASITVNGARRKHDEQRDCQDQKLGFH